MENNIKDILNKFFEGLVFEEEGHKYLYNNKKITYSVSDMVKKYSLPFNRKEKALSSAKKRGISVEEVLQEWDTTTKEACKRGHKAHKFSELYAFDRTLVPEDNYEKAAFKFFNELPPYIKVISNETKMVHKKYLFCGTDDLLLYNEQNGNIIIGDFKTNKDLTKNFMGQKLLSHFNHLLDTPFNKYQIQLSFYQILLEQVEQLKIAKRKIIHLRQSGEYFVYDTKDFTESLLKDLEDDYRRINPESTVSVL